MSQVLQSYQQRYSFSGVQEESVYSLAWLGFALLIDKTMFLIITLNMGMALFLDGGGELMEIGIFGFLYLSLRKK